MRPAMGVILLLTVSVHAGELQNSHLKRSERALLEQSTAAEQARIQAQSGSGYELELRPRVSEDEVGVALRIYLPERWKKAALREQLSLVAESEQLRVAALEWQELMAAYRLFCDYRMLEQQQVLLTGELDEIEPWLAKADKAVELNQLAVASRTKFYSLYLDLINDLEKVKADRLENAQELRLLLGAEADLNRMASAAVVAMPPKVEFDTLLKQALENRSDYRNFDVQARSLATAVDAAESVEGFRLKYLQPSYEVDHNNGEGTLSLSASFILPWGRLRPDVDLYRRQQALAVSEQQLQRAVIGHRLRVLLKTAEAYYETASDRSERIKPIVEQINSDFEVIDTGRLEELGNLLAVRERLLDISLQTTKATCRQERLAVDLAEELGTVTP